MKNILDNLQIDAAAKDQVLASAANYLRHAKLKTEILEVKGDAITVRIEQVAAPTDTIYTKKELIERAKMIFEPIISRYKIHVRPLVFSGSGIDAVSGKWVKSKLKEFGLFQNDLCDQMGIDKHAMSKLLNNQYEFTRWHKAAFFYFFKHLELKLQAATA